MSKSLDNTEATSTSTRSFVHVPPGGHARYAPTNSRCCITRQPTLLKLHGMIALLFPTARPVLGPTLGQVTNENHTHVAESGKAG